MSRARTEVEYLAGIVPSSISGTAIGRRGFLRGAMLAGAVVGGSSLLAACGGGAGGASGPVGLGSNYSEPTTGAVMDAWLAQARSSGIEVALNTIDSATYQTNINSYLQSTPDDVFAWFSGYRMRFFAEQGLAGDVSDVWTDLSGMPAAFRDASTANDGRQYFVPTAYGPWAMFYRKSLFAERGYTPPTTLDEMVTLGERMQADGLVPIAFADKDGWPAMGTFDHLNMRINGYRFHIDLLAGNGSWDGPEVRQVFETWREILPIHQEDALGRTWQEACTSLENKEAGMVLMGSFIGQQFADATVEDLDFFPFPEIDPAIGADAVEAPLDGFMMSPRPRNEEGAKNLLRYFGSAEAGLTSTSIDKTRIAANTGSSTDAYTPLQQKLADYVSSAGSVSQFMDRDTRPDFASTVMIPSIQAFLENPSDIDAIVTSIEAQKQSIFTS